MTGISSSDQRRKVADVLHAFERLEYDAYHEDLAEPMTRRMLDLLEGGAQDSAVRVRHARAESDLAEIRLRRGDTTQAQVLQESARKTLLDLQSSGYRDPGLQPDIDTVEQRLAKTKIPRATSTELRASFRSCWSVRHLAVHKGRPRAIVETWLFC